MSDKMVEAVSELKTTIETKSADTKKIIEEQKSSFEKQFLELKAEKEKSDKDWADKVKEINEDKAKTGATLEEIRKEVLEAKAASGRIRGIAEREEKTANLIAEAFKEHFEEIKAVDKGRSAKFEIKAVGNMTALANLTGNVVATYDLQPAVRGRRKVNLRDLVRVIDSATGVWKFYRENSPAPADGSYTQQTVHGNAKSQVDYSLTEVTIITDYLAAYVRFAKQMAMDLPFLQTFVAAELVEDYKRSESGLFIPTLTAAATGSTTTTAGAGLLAEAYIDWIANLMANDYDPSAIVTTAANWGIVLKTKPSNYSIPGGVQIDPDGAVRFVGIPMIPQNNMPAGKTLIGDFSKAAIIQSEGLSVQFFEQDQDNVIKNLITARCEARVGFAIMRLDAFVYGTNP